MVSGNVSTKLTAGFLTFFIETPLGPKPCLSQAALQLNAGF
jgi:hypothetical protein